MRACATCARSSYSNSYCSYCSDATPFVIATFFVVLLYLVLYRESTDVVVPIRLPPVHYEVNGISISLVPPWLNLLFNTVVSVLRESR